MSSLYQKIQRTETLQKTIDRDIRQFKLFNRIDCLEHCSECCRYDNIQATALEFLPFAWHTYRLGLLESWLEKLENHHEPQCVFYRNRNEEWGCSIYPVRGLICRLFGFSASLDKNGNPAYAACRILKQNCPEVVKSASERLKNGGRIPVISKFYRRLATIDPVSGNEFMPLNQAIKKALETVYLHYYYREFA